MTASEFIAQFRRWLLQEREAAKAQFEAARQSLDPAARIAAGIAVGELVVVDTGAASLGRASWTLGPARGELDPILRSGDPVLVYRRRAPDQSSRGLVVRRTRHQLTVVFDEPPDEELESSELVV